ncbi:MAG: hypothetical protein LUQ31_04695 [Methanoregula sp.]|nr:hypothetical protein [Methanoregula sp.]
MKYTPRHIKKFIEEGKIDPNLWKIHFPHLLPSHVPECSECEDKKNNLCQGGKNPVDCFLGVNAEEEKKKNNDPDKKSHKEKTKDFFPDQKGKKRKVPSGANVAFDQSKM